jgi:AcrR family transcriptional regulator
MARVYRLGKRGIAAAETRQRIMDAARELLFTTELRELSLHDVAADAGVTRSTIYQQFGSKGELLLAVVNDALDRADVQRVRKVLQDPDAATALRGLMRESTRFWAGEYALFSGVKRLALVDPAIAHVDQTKEGVRQGHITNLIGRLVQQGSLRPELSEERAATMLNLLVSYETYDQLRTRHRLSLNKIVATLTEMAERTLLPDA